MRLHDPLGVRPAIGIRDRNRKKLRDLGALNSQSQKTAISVHSTQGGTNHEVHIVVENAPACYRAPRWPDPEFPRKIPKKYPPARNSGLPEFALKIARKYRKNTPKIPKMTVFSLFSVFLGHFLGVPKFRPAGYFFGIFGGNSGSGHLGAL